MGLETTIQIPLGEMPEKEINKLKKELVLLLKKYDIELTFKQYFSVDISMSKKKVKNKNAKTR